VRPTEHDGRFFALRDLQVLPQPERRIPIWVGGASDAALRRAVELGDGWHGNVTEVRDVAPILKRLRAERDDDTFTLSNRQLWDGLITDHDQMRRDLDAFVSAGLQHLLVTPLQGDLDSWLRSVEALAALFEEVR
jgi:alkanesulfonate monooxygenase SsuD/methylene tetrahydromethanopterin reductase-like flavin-dependent oxidoreductase (luciferase family)